MSFDWLSLQPLAHAEFETRMTAITDWHAPTPDTEWDVSDLVRHVIDEQRWVPPLLDGRDRLEARRRLRPIGNDLVAEWRRHSRAATEAWATADLDRDVRVGGDVVTARDYLAEQVSDVAVHTWDLARATGSDESLPDALVEAAWSYFAPQRETLEATGLYGRAIELPDDPPLLHRLLALTGRDPR